MGQNIAISNHQHVLPSRLSLDDDPRRRHLPLRHFRNGIEPESHNRSFLHHCRCQHYPLCSPRPLRRTPSLPLHQTINYQIGVVPLLLGPCHRWRSSSPHSSSTSKPESEFHQSVGPAHIITTSKVDKYHHSLSRCRNFHPYARKGATVNRYGLLETVYPLA